MFYIEFVYMYLYKIVKLTMKWKQKHFVRWLCDVIVGKSKRCFFLVKNNHVWRKKKKELSLDVTHCLRV